MFCRNCLDATFAKLLATNLTTCPWEAEEFLTRFLPSAFSLVFKVECGTDKTAFKVLTIVAFSPCSFWRRLRAMRLRWHNARRIVSPLKSRPSSSMPPIRVTDEQVQQLLSEGKVVPVGLSSPNMTAKAGCFRKSFDFNGAAGSEFVIKLRQTVINPANFSVILGYRMPGTYAIFRLRRYNGKHRHINVLEDEIFHDFHIHMATERYQRRSGFWEDHYAQPTNRHFDFKSAIEALIEDCGFSSKGSNYSLFAPKP